MSWQAEAWVQSNPHITSQMDYCVMVTLANWCNEKGEWSPSWSTWAKAARCSVISVRRAVDRLTDAGVLSIVRQGGTVGKTNTYRINMGGYALPSLKPDDPEDIVLHKLHQAAKENRLDVDPPPPPARPPRAIDKLAELMHTPAHLVSTPQGAHNEHPPAHLDEHPPAHPDEHLTTSTTSTTSGVLSPGWEADPVKRKAIADRMLASMGLKRDDPPEGDPEHLGPQPCTPEVGV